MSVQDTAPSAAALIAAVRANGSDPRDLRDAAHEACHALDFDVPAGQWDRESIHERAPTRSDLVRAEVLARAVERIVCERLGQPLTPDECAQYTMIAGMEMLRNSRIEVPLSVWQKGIALAYTSTEAARMADRVLALAAAPTAPPASEHA